MANAVAIQMASGPNMEANLLDAERLIQQAVQKGGELIVLPENFALMGMTEADKVTVREREGDGPIQDFVANQAKWNKVWIVGGTIPLECPHPQKVYAASMLYDDQGRQIARYDKLHLFDVRLEGSGESYTESETILPGEEPAVVDTPFGRLGLAVCYDLRFPELFRCMLEKGVEIAVLPAAFTALTGKAHWEILVRARAIENLMYVVAANQGGYHLNGRETHGHSMVVDPWGTVRDEVASGAGIAVGAIDRTLLESTRRNFPSIEHRRLGIREAV